MQLVVAIFPLPTCSLPHTLSVPCRIAARIMPWSDAGVTVANGCALALALYDAIHDEMWSSGIWSASAAWSMASLLLEQG